MEVYMPGFKKMRLEEDIKREISSLMLTEIKDPRVNSGLVSVVRTEMSSDGSHCKVYVSSLDGMDSAREAVKGLESALWIFKKAITNKLRLKKSPELKFIADDSIEHSAKIEKMLESISSEEKDENGEE